MKLKSYFTLSFLVDTFYLVAGILFATFALKSLLVPNSFLDGGVTGISLLLHEIYHWPLSIVIVVVNFPFVLLSAKIVDKNYAIRTFISIILLGLSLQFMPFGDITGQWHPNMVFIALFGGFFLGLGIGLGMRGGSAIDGIEIMALYTKKRIGLTMSELILGINVLIFLLAALGLGLEKALYAMLTYYVATRTIDYVIEGIEEYTSVTIISSESQIIKEKLVREMGRGITVYKGERGFLKESFDVSYDCDIIFLVVTRLEVRKIQSIIPQIDPKAFIFTSPVKEATGGILKHLSARH